MSLPLAFYRRRAVVGLRSGRLAVELTQFDLARGSLVDHDSGADAQVAARLDELAGVEHPPSGISAHLLAGTITASPVRSASERTLSVPVGDRRPDSEVPTTRSASRGRNSGRAAEARSRSEIQVAVSSGEPGSAASTGCTLRSAITSR